MRIAISQRRDFSTDADFRAWLTATLARTDGLYLREKAWDDTVYTAHAEWLLQHIPQTHRPHLMVPFRPAFLRISHAWIFQVGGGLQHLADLKQTLGDRYRLIYSAHTLEEAQSAATHGADFIFLSPIFVTPSKPGARPLGLETLRKAVASIAVPIIALGGITSENVLDIEKTGAYGAAGIRFFQNSFQ